MKFYVKKDQFKRAVNIVSKAVPTATTLEVLECVLMEAYDNNLRLTANNFEMAIQTSLPVILHDAGTVCVNGKLLQKIVAANPDEEIMVETNDKFETTIKSKTMKFDLPGRSGDDFAMPPQVDKENSLLLQKEDFKEAIKKSTFCAKVSDDNNNTLMSGGSLKITNNLMTLTITDGHRMAVRSIELDYDSGKDNLNLLVPIKTLNDIASIIGSEDGEMEINYTDHQCLFSFDDIIVTARLLAGRGIGDLNFNPDKLTVSMDRILLQNSIENAILLGENMPMLMSVKDDAFQMSYKSTLGQWNGKVPCKYTGDENLLLGFNPKYLNGFIKSIDEEELILHFTGKCAPCYLVGKNYKYMLMPINVGDIAA